MAEAPIFAPPHEPGDDFEAPARRHRRDFDRLDREYTTRGRAGFDAPAAPRMAANLMGSGPTTARVFLCPSGESVAVRPVDGDGNYLKIQSIQSGNDEQTFNLGILPGTAAAAASFTLGFNGQTTAAIPFTAALPGNYCLWSSIAVTAGHTYRIALPLNASVFNRDDLAVQIYEGGALKAQATLDQYQNLTGDFAVANTSGNGGVDPVTFRTLFPTYTPASSSIAVLLSAPYAQDGRNNGSWTADAVHLHDNGTNAVTIVDDDDSSFTYGCTNGPTPEASTAGYHEYYNGSHKKFLYGNGVGPAVTVDPVAIQAAMVALSGIGTNTAGKPNVIVTALGASNTGPFRVQFVNDLGATAQPDLTSATPGFAIPAGGHVQGGFVPSLTRTPQGGSAGTPIRLTREFLPSAAGGVSWAFYAFDGGSTNQQNARFLATDTATLAIPAGWLTLAGNVPFPAGTYAVENAVGGSMLPDYDPSMPTMAIGQNVIPDNYFNENFCFLNVARRPGNTHMAPVPSGTGIITAWDSNGDPTAISDQSIQGLCGNTRAGAGDSDGVGGIAQSGLPSGKYTFLWAGNFADFTVGGGAHTNYAEDLTYKVIDPNNLNHRRVYNCQPDSGVASPWVLFNYNSPGPQNGDGTWPCSIKNVRVYTPDPADPTGMTPWLNPIASFPSGASGKFHPAFLRMMRTAATIRPMQALNAPYNPVKDYADYMPDSWLNRSGYKQVSRSGVTRVAQYAGSTTLDSDDILLLQFTTLQPHGFHSGMPVVCESVGTVTVSDNRVAPFPLDGQDGHSYGQVDVLDDHNFVLHAGPTRYNGVALTGLTMTNVLQAAQGQTHGAVRNLFGTGLGTAWSVDDCIDLANDLDILYPGYPRRLWFTGSLTSTEACVRAVAARAATRLRPNVKFCWEGGNECWNGGYPTNGWLTVLSKRLYNYGDYHAAYAVIQGQSNAWCQAEFTAAGRAGDFIHGFAVQSSGGGSTQKILGFAAAPPNGDPPYPCAEVWIAPYVNNWCPGYNSGLSSSDPSYDPNRENGDPRNVDTVRTNLWSVGMNLDLLELNTDDHGFDYTADKQPYLDQFYPDARFVAYEGDWESLIAGLHLNYEYKFSNLFALQRGIHRHHRMHGISLHNFRRLQEAGIATFTNFYIHGFGSSQAYSAYESWNQQDGTGAPTENPDYRNTSDLTSGGQVPVVSQVGGAVNTWMADVKANLTGGSTLAAGTASAGTATNTTATASATEAAGATGSVAHQWYRSTASGQTGTAVSGQTSLNLSDSGLAAGTPYYYRLKYTDSTTFVYSNQVTLTTTGSAPAALAAGTATAGAATASTATASATDATGGTAPYTYQWYRSTASGQTGSAISGQTTRTLSDSGLAASTAYYYTLKYTDSSTSVYSNQVTLTTTGGATPPASPAPFALAYTVKAR